MKLNRRPVSVSNSIGNPDLSDESSGAVVGERDIAQVVSTITGIPLSVLQRHGGPKTSTTSGTGTGTAETELLELEQMLGRAVIGQQLAVSAVCNALRVAKAG